MCRLLAERLGVTVFPTICSHKGQKLSRKEAPDSTALAKFVATHAPTSPPTSQTTHTPNASTSSNATSESPAPKGSVWDPPARVDKEGAKKMIPNRSEPAVYWPRMPCLRCGCPWWIGEDWDAKCGRCGWDCETDGYDDDSQPLKTGNWRTKYAEFSAYIKEGKTAPWPPRKAVR